MNWRRLMRWIGKRPVGEGRRDVSAESRQRMPAADRLHTVADDMRRLQQVAIRRLRVLPVPSGGGVSVMHKLTMLAEFSRLGVRVVNPEALESASPELFLDYRWIIETLVEMQGGRVAYEPLFPGFPGELPREDDNFVYPLIDYVAETPGPGAADAGVVLEIVSPEEAVRRLRAWLADAIAASPPVEPPDQAGTWQEDVAVVQRLLGGQAIETPQAARPAAVVGTAIQAV